VPQVWTCPFCFSRNHFPAHYAEISETNLPGALCWCCERWPRPALRLPPACPAELFPQYSSVEYALPAPLLPAHPSFLFLVDTALPAEDLQHCTAAVSQAVALLPEEARVGLLAFGELCTLYELGAQEGGRAWVFRGDRDAEAYAPERIHAQLGIAHAHAHAPRGGPHSSGAAGGWAAGAAASRFLCPLAECEFALAEALMALQADPPCAEGARMRPARCTGAALAVAAALLEGGAAGGAVRLLLFTGGPCTVGPATVVGRPRSEELRSHKDFEKGSACYWAPAVAFYAQLGERLAVSACALDVFACALDQVGLAELKSCIEPTGGYCVMAETFRSDNLSASIARLLERSPGPGGALRLGGCGLLEVFTTKEVRVAGCVGAASPAPSRAAPGCAAEAEVGMGGTTAWRVATLAPDTTLALFFEVVNAHANPLPEGSGLYLQFTCSYTGSDGQRRLRVVTVARSWAASAGAPAVAQGFDQEATAVLLARLAAYKAEHEEAFDPLRWLDRTLIRLCAKYGDFVADQPRSLQLPGPFAYLPQFLFNLRRSPLLQVFNNSPDETAFFRLALAREPTAPALLMIQPTLHAYSFDAPQAQAVALDVGALTPERVLLLDTYFTLVVHTGATLAAWRKAGYAQQEEHGALRELLEAPLQAAVLAAGSRCPTARLVVCDQGGSQARFLLARLNPSATHATPPDAAGGGEIIFTEDVSLQVRSHATASACAHTSLRAPPRCSWSTCRSSRSHPERVSAP